MQDSLAIGVQGEKNEMTPAVFSTSNHKNLLPIIAVPLLNAGRGEK